MKPFNIFKLNFHCVKSFEVVVFRIGVVDLKDRYPKILT